MRSILVRADVVDGSEKHLSAVLCDTGDKFVVWGWNRQSGGFYGGQYFDRDTDGPLSAAKALETRCSRMGADVVPNTIPEPTDAPYPS
jgi:hypothetical protein